MARPPRDPSLLSWPWGSAPSGSWGPSSALDLASLPMVNSHAESAAMLVVVSPSTRGTSSLNFRRLDTFSLHFSSKETCCHLLCAMHVYREEL